MGIKFDFINHHFKLKYVDSGLYFVKDENSFINPLLPVGSGSESDEKSTGSGHSVTDPGKNITDPDPDPT